MDFLRGAGLHLPPPQKITTAIYKKYIKAYYLIFKLLFIISRECESFCINNRELRFQIIISFWDACGYIRRLIYSLLRLYSSCRTTLPKLFLSTLKKQSLCAVLSRSCSTSNEQRAPRMQSIRLWAAARSTARFLSSVPKSTFRNNCGRFVKGGMGRRLMRRVGTHQPSSGQYPHSDRQTLSVDLRSRCLRHGRKRSRTSGWVWENDTGLLRRFSNITRMIFSNVSA